MNYRHIYHAGNFADVIKHCILVALLQKLKEKDKPFSVLDAFAGIGLYDLSSEEASKTAESDNGIHLLFSTVEDTSLLPEAIAIYTEIVKSINSSEGSISLYPGSPYIISKLLRTEDNLLASELHPEDYALLRYVFRKEKKCAIHHIDAYKALIALLPPKHTRGLVLLDPPFEVKDEFSKILNSLKLVKKRYSTGVIMIWYPIKDVQQTQKFYDNLKTTGYSEFIKIEFMINSFGVAMNKCGILIANPPYIQDKLEEIMQFLCKSIYKGKANATVELLSYQ